MRDPERFLDGALKERICPLCGKVFVMDYGHASQRVYSYTDRNNRQPTHLCGWNCYRQYKYSKIMEKRKLTAEDVAWLRFAHFPVPYEKLPQWMKNDPDYRELFKEKKEGKKK